ncbi:haloacid dehalogenase, type II [Novosphingobium nitrogenifigens DSM 19370]|uniref:(S)-2-haloacid dehalogenase n=1 Tax=Novosphingobium nitrogenifigens DSM 19370 TaxID=983920 RepID=F1ZB47_9SPHN|nr:haloacid dehalogenase type II [Novosphingobium nitrogenifigens]EGD58086.1 haloacid dehalogenase, type II [Novosphingobium nitrogenifigens DSM 19370]
MSIPLDRRNALRLALSAALVAPQSALAVDAPRKLRALAFDGFTVFDVRAVAAAVIAMVPEQGAALASAWTNKLFALSWLETSAGRYSGFAPLADAALAFTAQTMHVTLTPAQRAELVAVFARLPLWPDALPTLTRMHEAGLRLAFLSNIGADMLASAMRRHGLERVMEPPLSTDRVNAFKPSPKAYAMGPAHFGLPVEDIGFVAFGGWDALGAKWFGYRTAWINRLGVATEPLSPAADSAGPDLGAALRLAGIEVAD